MNHERMDDMPQYLKWFMTFVNRIGFPIMVCVWLAYQQYVQAKDTVKAIQDFKEVMVSVKDTLDQQNKILRRRSKED